VDDVMLVGGLGGLCAHTFIVGRRTTFGPRIGRRELMPREALTESGTAAAMAWCSCDDGQMAV
jgi:hypothetical protein